MLFHGTSTIDDVGSKSDNGYRRSQLNMSARRGEMVNRAFSTTSNACRSSVADRHGSVLQPRAAAD